MLCLYDERGTPKYASRVKKLECIARCEPFASSFLAFCVSVGSVSAVREILHETSQKSLLETLLESVYESLFGNSYSIRKHGPSCDKIYSNCVRIEFSQDGG